MSPLIEDIDQLITEKIKLPPRKFFTYVDEILPKKIREYAERMDDVLKGLQTIPDLDLEETLWEIPLDPKNLDKYRDYVDPNSDDTFTENIAGILDTIETNSSLLKSDKIFRKREKIERVRDTLKRFIGEGEWTGGGFRFARTIEDIDPEDVQEDIEYAPREVDQKDLEKIQRVIELPKIWSEMKNTLREAAEKMDAKLTRMNKKQPDPADVEELYHASVVAKSIARNGFSKRVPDTKGLGGAQTTDIEGPKGTSFTADLYHAKQIMRALKEVAMIAHGEMGMRDIKNLAKQYNAWDETKRVYHSNYGHRGDWPDLSKGDLFELYNTFLYMSDRYNPVFMRTGEAGLKMFKDVDPKDIGIVKAKVDMTHSDISYKRAMEEYRVPPEAIIEVTDFIR